MFGFRAFKSQGRSTGFSPTRGKGYVVLIPDSQTRGDLQIIELSMVETWLASEFEGGRHARRLGKVAEMEADF